MVCLQNNGSAAFFGSFSPAWRMTGLYGVSCIRMPAACAAGLPPLALTKAAITRCRVTRCPCKRPSRAVTWQASAGVGHGLVAAALAPRQGAVDAGYAATQVAPPVWPTGCLGKGTVYVVQMTRVLLKIERLFYFSVLAVFECTALTCNMVLCQ